MYLTTVVKSFFRTVMVFAAGVVVGSAIFLGSAYVYFMYFDGSALIDSYLTAHNWPTKQDYRRYVMQVTKQNQNFSKLESHVNDLQVNFVNTVRLLPLRSPPVPDERSSDSNDSSPIVSSRLTARDKLDQQCAVWVLNYSSNPSSDLQHKIDKLCN